jgi:hypothetical protein
MSGTMLLDRCLRTIVLRADDPLHLLVIGLLSVRAEPAGVRHRPAQITTTRVVRVRRAMVQ